MAQVNTDRALVHAPGIIRFPGPIINRLLRLGLPIGPNWLLTARGRVSGEMRSQPLAVLKVHGGKYVVGTFGDVNWCRNLRANPNAEIRRGSRREMVTARELTTKQAADFFRNELAPSLPSMPLFSRLATKVFIASVAPEIMTDPDQAASRRPVFELVAREDDGGKVVISTTDA